jgi:hypothetical protein
MDDDSLILSIIKVIFVLGVVCSPLVWWIARQKDTAYQRCMDSGGAWTVTGSHVQSGFIMSGKVMVPTQTRVRDFGCIYPTPRGPGR